jgi:hypothetical protein
MDQLKGVTFLPLCFGKGLAQIVRIKERTEKSLQINFMLAGFLLTGDMEKLLFLCIFG